MASRATAVGARFAVVLGLAAMLGCGNTYRPVVSSFNPVGPAEQPLKFAVAIATTGDTTPGLVNIIDVSGDTVVDTTAIGANPLYLAIGVGGGTAYTLNGDGTVNNFSLSASLISNQVDQITLPAGALPNSLFSAGSYEYVSEPGLSSIGALQAAIPPTLRQQVTVGPNPVYIVGVTNAATARIYAISNGTTPGQVAAIETTTNSVSNTIPVGNNPVYGVMTADSRRVFIMNKNDGTISVINAQTNQLDTFTNTVTHTVTSTIQDPGAAAPVWADFAPTLNELIVANAGSSPGTRGSLSIISIPLCSSVSVTTNPTCDVANPIDAVGFGTVLANVPVGINPVWVSVLQDGTQAYVANAGTPAIPASGGKPAIPADPGSITVINLTTNTVIATIPAAPDLTCNPATPTTANPLLVCGHPSSIIAVTGIPTGKVYVVSTDSTNMTIIRTDTDIVQTQLPLQGYGVQVRATLP